MVSDLLQRVNKNDMNGYSPEIIPVVLCGGSGTRLWPLSRTHYPKQFLRLVGSHSLLQNTLTRLSDLKNIGKPIVIANEEHRFLLAEQLHEAKVDADILLEPVAKNTAPAVAAAAAWAMQRHAERRGEGNSQPYPLLLILPSDHVIADKLAFYEAILAAVPHALADKLVTFGVVPVRAETGYGYIKRGGQVVGGYAIEQFVEKPDRETAENYIATAEYYWNSGMFLFGADTYIDALTQVAPLIKQAVESCIANAKVDLDFVRLDKDLFSNSPADSIDYAVMEKSPDGVVIPLDAGWSDIGAWDALADLMSLDVSCNVTHGDVLIEDTQNSTLYAESRLLTAVGVDNLVVVETADAVLVANKAYAQSVKHIVQLLKEAHREEVDFHQQVHRPWGSYEGIASGDRYQVKRIIVKPGRSLSLQLHHHRAEHWVVVHGTARVTRGDEVLTLSENQSTYIPLGVKHRLENPGKVNLELIEIQSGTYLGEDDIVRFEDVYGRGVSS